jgi:Zn-dependent protease/CBS domain-containing protein
MKWSIRLGRVLGIDVYMHLTFLLLLAWVAWMTFSAGRSIAAAAASVLFVLALFACVVLHEFGHALTARRFGIRTRDITLLPIGGLARLERMPDKPMQELWVALAGPAVNVVIAAVLAPLVVLGGDFGPGAVPLAGGPLLPWLLQANIVLALFNLLPAFPMDGGRVLRALLATRFEYTQATQIAATVGQGMAFLFGFVGLFVFHNALLLFVALFVWIGAAQEASMVQVRSSLSGIPVRRAMITDFRSLRPGNTLAEAVDLTLETAQKDYPVVDGEQVAGMLLQADLVRALSERDPATPVTEIMHREFERLDAREMLDAALARLRESGWPTLPVYDFGRFVGLLTMDNVGELLSFRSVLGRGAPASSLDVPAPLRSSQR